MRAAAVWLPRRVAPIVTALFIVALFLCSYLFNGSALLISSTALRSASAIASDDASPPPPPLTWTLIDDVMNIDWPARRLELVTGCPHPPALCRAHHVYDAVFLISLPRFAARTARTAAQLTAAGVNFTLVRGHDARSGGPAIQKLAEIAMLRDYDKAAGTFFLYLTHLALLEAARIRGLRSLLILEDDVTLSSDFEREFDAIVRAAPTDYIMLQYCWLANEYSGSVPAPRGPRPEWVTPAGVVYQACAVALSTEGIAEVYRAMEETREAIDGLPYDALFARFPSRMYAASPPLIVAPLFYGSTLGHEQTPNPSEWRANNRIDAVRFDLVRGFVRGGERGTALACTREEAGVDFFGQDLIAPATSAVAAATPAECCAACKDGWPYCRAYTHIEDMCYLKSSDAGRRAMTGAQVTSGFVEQVPIE
jgi:hypothetical protein